MRALLRALQNPRRFCNGVGRVRETVHNSSLAKCEKMCNFLLIKESEITYLLQVHYYKYITYLPVHYVH